MAALREGVGNGSLTTPELLFEVPESAPAWAPPATEVPASCSARRVRISRLALWAATSLSPHACCSLAPTARLSLHFDVHRPHPACRDHRGCVANPPLASDRLRRRVMGWFRPMAAPRRGLAEGPTLWRESIARLVVPSPKFSERLSRVRGGARASPELRSRVRGGSSRRPDVSSRLKSLHWPRGPLSSRVGDLSSVVGGSTM